MWTRLEKAAVLAGSRRVRSGESDKAIDPGGDEGAGVRSTDPKMIQPVSLQRESGYAYDDAVGGLPALRDPSTAVVAKFHLFFDRILEKQRGKFAAEPPAEACKTTSVSLPSPPPILNTH